MANVNYVSIKKEKSNEERGKQGIYKRIKPCNRLINKALVRGMRFELTHPFGRYHLKVVRLPISPPTQLGNFEVGAKIGLSGRIFKGKSIISSARS
jgi:hypothetical protein